MIRLKLIAMFSIKSTALNTKIKKVSINDSFEPFQMSKNSNTIW